MVGTMGQRQHATVIQFPIEKRVSATKGTGVRQQFEIVDARLRRLDQALKSLAVVRATTMAVYLDLLDQLCP